MPPAGKKPTIAPLSSTFPLLAHGPVVPRTQRKPPTEPSQHSSSPMPAVSNYRHEKGAHDPIPPPSLVPPFSMSSSASIRSINSLSSQDQSERVTFNEGPVRNSSIITDHKKHKSSSASVMIQNGIGPAIIDSSEISLPQQLGPSGHARTLSQSTLNGKHPKKLVTSRPSTPSSGAAIGSHSDETKTSSSHPDRPKIPTSYPDRPKTPTSQVDRPKTPPQHHPGTQAVLPDIPAPPFGIMASMGLMSKDPFAKPDVVKLPPSSSPPRPKANPSSAQGSPEGYRQVRSQRREDRLENAPPPELATMPVRRDRPSEPFPLDLFVANHILCSCLLNYLSFYEWCVLMSVSKKIRLLFIQMKELQEAALERYLKTVGYASWTWPEPEPLQLTLVVS
jgi:hypothetical protein